MTISTKFTKGQKVIVDVSFMSPEVIPETGTIRTIEIIEKPAAGLHPVVYGVFVEGEIVHFGEDEILSAAKS